MRLPGIEPGLEAVSLLLVKLLPAKGCWEAPVIPLDHSRTLLIFWFIVRSSRRRDGHALQRRNSGRSGPQPHVDLYICYFFAVILGQGIYHLWFKLMLIHAARVRMFSYQFAVNACFRTVISPPPARCLIQVSQQASRTALSSKNQSSSCSIRISLRSQATGCRQARRMW